MAAERQAEPVRLVVWDLDETYWHGTLSEGGIRYRRDCHDIVLELARRGIVSSICSKNDARDVRQVLEREGIWDSFVFPSINWEAKGPRLAALVESVQLRPSTILFIDDNPMNRAEAQHFVPGIQVADEAVITGLLRDPLFRGKDDSRLSRLAQYKLLERRQGEEKAAGSDTSGFLRSSNIRISIEHDMEPHIDRAIELINRTNQLNFTKTRLPEDIAEARAELRKLLSDFRYQAGILRVVDNYGDYGYCGLYIMRSGASGRRLLHFCFSCRILNMGIETWLYRHLGRPALKVAGEVLSDVVGDDRPIDWITVELPEALNGSGSATRKLDYVYARGGCDLHAVSHYFELIANDVHREFNVTRNGANLRLDHTIFARYALCGIDPAAQRAFEKVGFAADDFTSIIPRLPRTGNAAWLMSVWADADFALYRHKATGEAIPLSIPGLQTNMRDVMHVMPEELTDRKAVPILRYVQKEFEYLGSIEEREFRTNLALILRAAPVDVPVFVLLANEADEDVRATAAAKKTLLNAWTIETCKNFSNVTTLDINDFVFSESEVITHNHFDRMVYFRIYQHILQRTGSLPDAKAEPDRSRAVAGRKRHAMAV